MYCVYLFVAQNAKRVNIRFKYTYLSISYFNLRNKYIYVYVTTKKENIIITKPHNTQLISYLPTYTIKALKYTGNFCS